MSTRRAFLSLLASAIGALAVQFSVPKVRELSWAKVRARFCFLTPLTEEGIRWASLRTWSSQDGLFHARFQESNPHYHVQISCPLEDVLE